MPPLWSRSSTKWRAPVTRLPPPVSIARFIAAGLPGSVLVGASDDVRIPAAKRARSLVRQSTSAASTTESIAADQAR